MAGNPNWRKGVSGNPGGRPKVVAEVRELAREHTEQALNTLVTIMGDEKANHSARVAAATQILDRGYGRAPQSLTVKGNVETHIIALLKSLDDQEAKPINGGEVDVLPEHKPFSVLSEPVRG